ncbi:MAG TPA: Ku protein [Actinomycetota bacterium]|jgi:DNA end-binding protein Ku|nr:Ku protein [Actinomycetota bacterium]
MPRTMWKGAISFGLVSIPIRLYPATEEKTLRFNQLHDKDHGRIKYQRVCSICGEEVPFEHIVKGYEYEKGKYVVLEDEDFEAVPVQTSRAIDIVQFVALEEIDPIYFQKSYYLVPEETGIKAYNLLREAMSEDGRVAVAKVAIREKEHLAALRFKDNVFVLETMYWPDEIRAADFEELDQDVDVRPQEVQMARSLIENLTEEFKPQEFRDEYREALLGVVEKKVAGEEIEAVPEPETTRVVDLMDALKASVDATKKKAEEPKKRATKKATARQPAREKKRAAS